MQFKSKLNRLTLLGVILVSLATWVYSTSANTRCPKVYRALLTQYETSDPEVIVLENTLGTITWTRAGYGDYRGTSSGLFTANKTWPVISPSSLSLVSLGRNSVNEVELDSADGDDILRQTAVEILVYDP